MPSPRTGRLGRRLMALMLPIGFLLAVGLAMVISLNTCGYLPLHYPTSTPVAESVSTPVAVNQPTPAVMSSPTSIATLLPTLTVKPSPIPTPPTIPTAKPAQILEEPEAALVGRWEGLIRVVRSEVPVSATLQLVEGELWGTLGISSQSIENIAFSATLETDGRIRFVIPQPESEITFDGILENGVISGHFRQGIFWGTFRLERTATEE